MDRPSRRTRRSARWSRRGARCRWPSTASCEPVDSRPVASSDLATASGSRPGDLLGDLGHGRIRGLPYPPPRSPNRCRGRPSCRGSRRLMVAVVVPTQVDGVARPRASARASRSGTLIDGDDTGSRGGRRCARPCRRSGSSPEHGHRAAVGDVGVRHRPARRSAARRRDRRSVSPVALRGP